MYQKSISGIKNPFLKEILGVITTIFKNIPTPTDKKKKQTILPKKISGRKSLFD